MEAELRSMRAEISRQDMASWVINVHVRWLSKVHSRIKAELLSHDLMHADETTIQEPSRKPTRKSRMRLFCSAKRDTPAYVYEHHETRGKSVAEGFLRGWKGTLTTDGYRPYFNLQEADVTNTACLVHGHNQLQLSYHYPFIKHPTSVSLFQIQYVHYYTQAL